MIYGAFTKDDPFGYILCAMWVVVSYVRYNMLVTANVELEAIKQHIMSDVRKDLKKFLKENKEHLINKLNQEEE